MSMGVVAAVAATVAAKVMEPDPPEPKLLPKAKDADGNTMDSAYHTKQAEADFQKQATPKNDDGYLAPPIPSPYGTPAQAPELLKDPRTDLTAAGRFGLKPTLPGAYPGVAPAVPKSAKPLGA